MTFELGPAIKPPLDPSVFDEYPLPDPGIAFRSVRRAPEPAAPDVYRQMQAAQAGAQPDAPDAPDDDLALPPLTDDNGDWRFPNGMLWAEGEPHPCAYCAYYHPGRMSEIPQERLNVPASSGRGRRRLPKWRPIVAAFAAIVLTLSAAASAVAAVVNMIRGG